MLMQSKELISIINSYWNHTDLPDFQNWEELFYCAKKHSVSSIFYEAVKSSKNVPEAVKQAAEKHRLAQISQQIAQSYYAEEICRWLKENQIRYMPLKGYILRSLYPLEELRSSCDVDIFYDVAHKNKVDEKMKRLGFSCKKDGEWQNGNVTVEMHAALVAENDVDSDYYQDVWNRLTTNDGIRFEFSKEDFYVYMIKHAKTHFLWGGFGVRTILDLYVYHTAYPSLDKEYLRREFTKLGVVQFETCLKELAFSWFGGKEATVELTELEKYIFQSGTYGIAQNRVAIVGGGKDQNLKTIRRRYLFKTLFPSYRIMCGKYPFLKKFPLLLPFMWGYKWFEVLFTRRQRIKSIKQTMQSVDEKQIQTTQKALEITGLQN